MKREGTAEQTEEETRNVTVF